VQSHAIKAMYAGGDAMLFLVRNGGNPTSYVHIYRTGGTGLFMYGVTLSKENDGAGQFLHWSIIRRLKADGFKWYDLGGVASCDPADGIYLFKARFGGSYVDLGTEWHWSGRWARQAARASALRNAMVSQ
jgi:hypothetical protein